MAGIDIEISLELQNCTPGTGGELSSTSELHVSGVQRFQLHVNSILWKFQFLICCRARGKHVIADLDATPV